MPRLRKTSAPRPQAGLRPPQFGLRSLLMLVGAVCVLLAIWKALGALAGALATLFALCVAIHMAGNFLGTQLRESAAKAALQDDGAPGRRPLAKPTADQFAPTTRLRERVPLGIWLIASVVGVGIVVGALAGAGWLVARGGEQMSIRNLALGSFACGLLGGMGGFALGGFLYVLVGALREAHLASRKRS